MPPPTFPNAQCPNLNVDANQTKTTWNASDYKTTPDGYLCFGNMTLRANVTLPANSVIVLDAGSLSIGSQAQRDLHGLHVHPASRTADTNPASIGNVDINGGATVNLTASNYRHLPGLIMYQDRRAVNGTDANHQSRSTAIPARSFKARSISRASK